MAKKKIQNDKVKDIQKRNDEMAEGKSPDEVAAIYREGDKYYCAECHLELPVHQSCPGCHKHIDWDRVQFESR